MSYYPMPHPGYHPAYDYSTSTSASPSPDDYDYYGRLRSPGVSPGRVPTAKSPHARTPSFSSPRVSTWSPPGYHSPGYYAAMPNYSAPPAKNGYVSTKESHNNKTSPRRYSVSGGGKIYVDDRSRRYESTSRSRKQDVFVDKPDEAKDRYYREPVYTYAEPRTAPATRTTFTAKKSSPARKADNYFYYTQTTSYEADTPTRSRVRRQSTSTSARKQGVPLKPAKVPDTPAATAADAARHKIPAGFALKNWDPTEEPIILLGSVFDANSLGKWIYDWTLYHHKSESPIAEVAGELWLLLIKFASKMKRAEEGIDKVRGHDRRETVSDFLAAGDRIWTKLKNLLKACEEYMWKVAKKGGDRVKAQMGEKSGIEFVKSIFGRERELEKTEQLMTSVRLWNMRFDANCEEIIRRPTEG